MKRTTMKRLLLPLSVSLLSGCAIHQNVTPVTQGTPKEICVISQPKVRKSFSEELSSALQNKGIGVRTVTAASPLDTCPYSITYNATWKWAWALYMAHAEIRVYANGLQAGKAIYDSTHGPGNMGKFIDAKTKIYELVDALFPNAAVR